MKTIEQRMRHATQLLGKVKICLLAGGYSSESQGSRENAKTLLPYLKKSCMDAGIVDFDSKDDLIQRLRPWDYILNICYGVGGEDGQLQGFLSTMDIPSSGSSVLTSAVGMNKYFFKALIKSWGFNVPQGVLATALHEEDGQNLKKNYNSLVIKPLSEGDSEGIILTKSITELERAISNIPENLRSQWLIEEFIYGDHGTISVFRDGSDLIISDAIIFDLPKGSSLYDKKLKYRIEDPIPITELDTVTNKHIKQEVNSMYRALKCDGLVRFDFVVRDGKSYYLEINTIPGLYPGSNTSRCFGREMSFEQFFYISLAADIARYEKFSQNNRGLHKHNGIDKN
jgi:D-alanine-D-alanine ligase